MRMILAALMLIIAPVTYAQNGSPKLSIERTDHNFGEVARGESPTHTFTFKNTGDSELRIVNVAPS